MNLNSLSKNLVIVPVSICYDRLFESINIATEMISGEYRKMGFYEAFAKLG